MDEPLVITVAAVGAELTLDQQPGLPTTPEMLARDAAACAAAGASIYHLHVRDDEGRPTMDVPAFMAAATAIGQASDLIVQFTTGGAVGDTDDARVAPLSLRPEMATLTTGSVNFGSQVFLNPLALIERLYDEMRAHDVLPEYEIFEAGMIATAVRLHEDRGEDHHMHFDLVLGVPGALPAWTGVVGFLRDRLPPGATWSATGIGRAYPRVLEDTLEAGGHVRTGFEDVRYLASGERATSNAQLVAEVAAAARSRGREVASPARARSLLGLA